MLPILKDGFCYCTSKEFAELTFTSHNTVLKWLKQNKIEGAVMIGKRWRIPLRVVRGSSPW